MGNRRVLLRGAAAAALAGSIGQAWPQEERPITLVVPYAPGGTTDMLARLLGQHMATSLKRNVIVLNKPGAGTSLGASQVARAAPDGATLLVATSTTLAINPWLYKKLPYDPAKDFSPIGLIGSVPLLVVVHPDLKAKTLADLVALAKASPGALAFGSAGNGSPQHLAAEMFEAAVGVKLNHVAYKGSGPALTDLLGGQLQLMFTDMAPALPHVRAGKLRALALTSRNRQGVVPDIPTIAESGVAGTAGFDAVAWQSIVAPAGTAPTLIEQYSKVLQGILTQPDMRKRLESEGLESATSTPEQLAAYMRSETERWGNIIKQAGITLD